MCTFNKMVLIVGLIAAGAETNVHAGVGGEIVKQTGRAISRVVIGKVAETGVRNTAKQLVKKIGHESAEAIAKKGVTTLATKATVIDDAANVMWRNKGVIVGSAALATAVANPKESFAAGASVLGTGITAGAEHVVGPLSHKVANDAGGLGLLLSGLCIVVVGLALAYGWFKGRCRSREV